MKSIEEIKKRIWEGRKEWYEIGGYKVKVKKRCAVVEPSHVVEAIEDVIGDGIEFYEIFQKLKKISKLRNPDEYKMQSEGVIYSNEYEIPYRYIYYLMEEYFLFQNVYPEYIESLEHLLDSAYGREWWKRFPDGSIGFYEDAFSPPYGGMFQLHIHEIFIPECLYRKVFEGSFNLMTCYQQYLPWHTQKLYPELPLTVEEWLKDKLGLDIYYKVMDGEDYDIIFHKIGPRKSILSKSYRPLNFEYDREEMEEGEVRMSIIFASRPTKKAVQRLHDVVREWYEMVKDADEPYGKVMGMREVDFREEYEYRFIGVRKKCYGYRWELDLRGSNIETMAVLGAMLVRYSEEESRLGVVYFW